jgi:hypothetical protein
LGDSWISSVSLRTNTKPNRSCFVWFVADTLRLLE